MRYPEFLNNNGSIGFVAPSFGCATKPYSTAFNMATVKFMEMGYNLIVGPNAYESKGIGISNTPDACAKELMDMYLSEDTDALISCGGGELMCEILEYLDFNKLSKAKPKFFLGYSDNTNFTFLQNILTDTASIYGPCAGSFAAFKWHKSLQDTWDVLTGKGYETAYFDANGNITQNKSGNVKAIKYKKISGYPDFELVSLKNENNPAPEYNLTEKKELKLYQGDRDIKNDLSDSMKLRIEGRLIGGCMDCLANILGTSFDKVGEFIDKYKNEKIVWFLESCDLNVFDIRRAMWRMDNAGWFKNVGGFIIGRPMHFNESMMNLDQYKAITGIVGKYNVPIIMDADFGHLSPSMPIISGSYVKVEAIGNDIDIFYYLR